MIDKKRTSWNAGLTKENNNKVKEMSIKISNSKKGKIPKNINLLNSSEIIKKRALSLTGYKQSEEHKRKIGLGNINKKRTLEQIEQHKRILKDGYKSGKYKIWNVGLTKEKDERVKIYSINSGLARRGKHLSDKTRLKQSLAHKGKIPKNLRQLQINRGLGLYPLSKESIEKMSKSQKELWNKPEMKEFARERRSKQIFPSKDTNIEIKIQNYLKQLNINFFTHVYMKEIKHSYQCDIFIPVQKNKNRFISQPIIIECDGDYWHGNKERFPNTKFKERILKGIEIDKIKAKELEERGYKVLRLWESEINPMKIQDFKTKLTIN